MAIKPLTRLLIWTGVLLASWALFLGLMWGVSQITAQGMSLTRAAIARLAPPPEYDYEPRTPYTVHLIGNADVLAFLCVNDHPRLLGCAKPSGKIFIRKGLSSRDQSLILRHERAHLNGWQH